MAQTTQVIFSKRPGAEIIPSQVFTTTKTPRPQPSDLKPGQVIVETLYLSLDPIMSYWIRGKKYEYMDLREGDQMPGMVVCRVLDSKAEGLKAGDVGTAFYGWATHAIVEGKDFDKRSLYPGVKETDFLNAIGVTGLTGYFGMLKCGQPKEGDLVVVSTAAGATGSVAAQTAKNMGARVVGITGSEEKVTWLKEDVGLDMVLNYKDPDFETKFTEVTGGKIDVYFDNVGGRMLELAIDNLNTGGRIAICGDLSSYENPNPHGIKVSPPTSATAKFHSDTRRITLALS